MERINKKTLKLVQLGVLTAIMIVMEVTGLGLIKTAGFEIALFLVPVIIGAIALGKSAGAFLGGVFGLMSFIECFGKSAFGTVLLGINPITTFIVCMVPRILCGWLAGFIFDKTAAIDKTKFLSYAASGLSCALINTTLFMSGIMIFFGNTEFMLGLKESMVGSVDVNVFAFLLAFVGVNGLVEAITCIVVGVAIAKVVVRFVPARQIELRSKKNQPLKAENA